MLFPLNYSSDLRYLRNKDIQEYDIQSGGYSVTISENLIEDEVMVAKLRAATKTERQIMLGNYIRDNKGFTKELHAGFQKYIAAFIVKNDIPDDNILSIKKDSITFFNNSIQRTRFKEVNFTNRGKFTSYLKLGKLEFYYNGKTKAKLLKGLSLNSYTNTLVEEVFTILSLAEFQHKSVINQYITELRQAYVQRELENSYYRELSVNNGYLIKEQICDFTLYSDFPFNSDQDQFSESIDITYNYKNILMPLFELFIN